MEKTKIGIVRRELERLERWGIRKLRQGIYQVRLKLKNKVEFGKGRRGL